MRRRLLTHIVRLLRKKKNIQQMQMATDAHRTLNTSITTILNFVPGLNVSKFFPHSRTTKHYRNYLHNLNFEFSPRAENYPKCFPHRQRIQNLVWLIVSTEPKLSAATMTRPAHVPFLKTVFVTVPITKNFLSKGRDQS